MSCNWYDVPCAFNYFMQWLQKWFLWLQGLWEKFLKFLGDLPKKAWAEILDASAAALEAIPVPDFISQASNAFSGLAPSVLWITDMFAVKEVFAILISAYLLRFFIRRLPIVG